MVAAIIGAIDPALRPALDDLPRLPVLVIHRRVERGRRLAVDHEVHRANAVVDVEDLLPRLAAIDRPEHPALFVLRKEVAERGDIHHVRPGRVNHDARDVVRIGQPHGRPGLARINRLENAFARDGAPRIRLIAAAGPDDLRVRGGERNGARRLKPDAVGDVVPGGAAVDRLPHATTPTGGIHRVEMIVGRARRDVDGRHPGPGAERADVPEGQTTEHLGQSRRRRLGGWCGRQGGQQPNGNERG